MFILANKLLKYNIKTIGRNIDFLTEEPLIFPKNVLYFM